MFGKNVKYWDTSEDAILMRTKNCLAYFDLIPALFENIDIQEFEEAFMKDINTSIAFLHNQIGTKWQVRKQRPLPMRCPGHQSDRVS